MKTNIVLVFFVFFIVGCSGSVEYPINRNPFDVRCIGGIKWLTYSQNYRWSPQPIPSKTDAGMYQTCEE